MNALTKDFTDVVEKQFEKLNGDVQDALQKANVVEMCLFDLEQKLASRGRHSGQGDRDQTWGDQFIEATASKPSLTCANPARLASAWM
jgi:hypothetical protein